MTAIIKDLQKPVKDAPVQHCGICSWVRCVAAVSTLFVMMLCLITSFLIMHLQPQQSKRNDWALGNKSEDDDEDEAEEPYLK
jgi:hypothetical protein